jgi:glutathione S-transferase
MSYVLYYHPNSGHAYKVAMFFALGDIPVTMRFIDIGRPHQERPADFRERAPFGEVPLLIDGERALAQSNNILLHLAERTGLFGPFDGVGWADIRTWLFWESYRLGVALPNLRFGHRFDPSMPKGALEWLDMRIRGDLSRLEKELADGRPFILGEQLTIVDLSLAGYIFWADQGKVELADWPNVFQWRERLTKQKGWQPPEQLMPFMRQA